VDRLDLAGDVSGLETYRLISRPVTDLESPARLPEEPAPRLKRPVLFLHGYMGKAEEFGDMMRWLERDGQNRSGGILDGARPGPVDPQANAFALRFSKGWQSVEANAKEVQRAVEEICKATGAAGVDVVAHSKGGLDTRQYLMDPTEKVDHVVMIGTPNQGTILANIELLLREQLGRPINPPSKDPEAAATLRQLTVDALDRRGQPQNPTLRNLNATWETQNDRAEFLAIDGNGIPTLSEHVVPTLLGDGTVPRKSAIPPETPSRHIWFYRHGSLARSANVMREVAAFLTDSSNRFEVDLFDSPEDRDRAERMGLLTTRDEGEGFLADRRPGSAGSAKS
jgi:pimeloyl-ACP methyl ester carboxylesterase